MTTKGTITLYSLKSKRKNSRCTYKSMSVVEGSKNMKEFFTLYDLYDFADFIAHAPYHNFKLVVYDRQGCICTFDNINYRSDIEGVLNLLYDFMRIINFREWDFSLADLHNDPNIRFHINQFYHPEVK